MEVIVVVDDDERQPDAYAKRKFGSVICMQHEFFFSVSLTSRNISCVSLCSLLPRKISFFWYSLRFVETLIFTSNVKLYSRHYTIFFLHFIHIVLTKLHIIFMRIKFFFLVFNALTFFLWFLNWIYVRSHASFAFAIENSIVN